MSQTINWVPPSSTSVGSVLIYRAATTAADALGSRTILTTIGAKDGSGNWVTTYTDSSGTSDHIYRVQFWDGVGSSPLSDPYGEDFSEQIATFDEVLRIARITGNYEVGSQEIFDAIADASDEVFFNYGDPIRKSQFFLDSTTGTTGQAYDFTGDWGPVYQVREVFVDAIDTRLVANSLYDIDYANGTIRFTDAFIGSYQGKNVYVHWVPSIFNILVKNMAALSLVEGELLFAGADVESPYVQKLKNKITMVEDYIRPKGLYTTKSFETETGYDIIPQKTDRTSIYFNT